MGKKLDLTGHVYGKLAILHELKYPKPKRISWVCQCSCGNLCTVTTTELRCGDTKSCGCTHKEQLIARNYKHGNSKSSEYHTWQSLRDRCLNPKNKMYKHYGARGISVCSEWLNSFENFYKDMGNKPTCKHSIDRINNNGNYCLENCRWVTQKVQVNNSRLARKITHPVTKESLCCSDWSKRLRGNRQLVSARINTYGWSEERAITTMVNKI